MRNIATTRILHAPEGAGALGSRSPWVWPLPRLDGVAPCIVGPVDESRPDGVDVGYPDRSSSPGRVPVLAAHDGVITYAGTSRGSPTVCLDHAGGWSTQYADLEHVFAMPTDRFRRRRKTRVRAGDVLGHARRSSPRLRFGMARLGESGWCIVDPAKPMLAWSVLPWFAEPLIGRAA
jgi:murein DD-endopeptidase MepM/ murein hydrolase activator NlpD